jgi:hypothetical protein
VLAGYNDTVFPRDKIRQPLILKRILYRDLLQGLSEKARRALHPLFQDDEVHYLIVLQSNPDSKPKVLPAGPKMDFRSPKDAAGQVIRGLRRVGYVDLRAERNEAGPVKSGDAAGPNRPQEGPNKAKARHALEAKLVWHENEKAQLEQRLRKAQRILREKEIKIAELAKRNEMLTARMDEYNCSGDVDTEERLKDIENAENELISRMNELMRKEAEIEQREIDLGLSKPEANPT